MGEPQPLQAGIVDFNPKRMTPEEARAAGIPDDLTTFLADHRQYALNIARQFPEGVAWFDAQTPWFFRDTLADPSKQRRLSGSDVLILSGSGMSAHRYQEGVDKGFKEGDRELLAKSEQLVRDHLGEGKWVLGICFGGQIGITAVGGEIGRLPENEHGNSVTEAGWLSHQLTDAGRDDEVFGELPDRFYAPHFHNDYVTKLPEVGSVIKTKSGDLKVTRAEILAIRKGYLDRDGLHQRETSYIHACIIEFENGARLYQIQPHPEMATPEKANFLVRKNPWLAGDDEMGQAYYDRAMLLPDEPDFAVARVITRFTEKAREHLERVRAIAFARSVIAYDYLTKYAVE